MQVIRPRVKIIRPSKGVSSFEEYDGALFMEKYGFLPEGMVDYLALMGDSVDKDTVVRAVKDMFKENCGIALTSQDPVAVAKAVSEFAKTSKLFTVRHASLEGKMLSAAQVDALAKLPGKQELLGQVLGTMNAVPTNFVSLFANMVRPLMYALKAIEEKKAA